MNTEPLYQRQSHPLARGIYTARYAVKTSNEELVTVEGDMVVASESDWRLVAEWRFNAQTKAQVPVTRWAVPPDCQFRILRIAQQPIISICRPVCFGA